MKKVLFLLTLFIDVRLFCAAKSEIITSESSASSSAASDKESADYTKYSEEIEKRFKEVCSNSEIAKFPPGVPQLFLTFMQTSQQEWEANGQRLCALLLILNDNAKFPDRVLAHNYHEIWSEIENLLETDFNVNATYKGEYYQGETALSIATYRRFLTGRKKYNFIKLLLDKGADTKIKYKGNNTLLHYALDFQLPITTLDIDIVKLLIKHGAEVNVKNDAGQTPLLRLISNDAIETFPLELVKILINTGDDVNTNCTKDNLVDQNYIVINAMMQNESLVRNNKELFKFLLSKANIKTLEAAFTSFVFIRENMKYTMNILENEINRRKKPSCTIL